MNTARIGREPDAGTPETVAKWAKIPRYLPGLTVFIQPRH
jgi:hypothetical protein